MATGLASWVAMTQWTTQSMQQYTTEPSRPAQGSHQDIHMEQATRVPLPPLVFQPQKSKIMQQVQEADFQYLRQVSPPIDPDILEAQYGLLLQRPKSPPTAHTCRFRPENITDTRVRQWAWWEALSKVKVYVREYYMYTRWAARANATATGTPVQEFVRTHHGTVTLVPHDTRIVVANHNRQLHVQIASGFEPWGPNTDMARRYHRGRVPVYVANTMQYHSTRKGFQ